MEVYVDDLLVKSKKVHVHVADLFVTFDVLKKYKMKQNLAKCPFGLASGKSLAFLVS